MDKVICCKAAKYRGYSGCHRGKPHEKYIEPIDCWCRGAKDIPVLSAEGKAVVERMGL